MRSQTCGQVNATHVGDTVQLCGWVNKRRDHGGVIFVDLRDRDGLVQMVFDPDTPEIFSLAEQLRNEFVIRVSGCVRPRPEGTVNPELSSGEIEVLGLELEILNRSETPPFQLDDDDVGEEHRLRYRYIDLRRPAAAERLKLRHRTIREMRNVLDDADFIEVETPMLTRATPEGARDYLVPSRVHPGQFYALPQSPQLYKQLLMMGGQDRYYQVARCFRDEDLRADRQPEFTQLDIEMSFVEEEDVMSLMEAMIRQVFKTQLNVDLANPFPRMTYAESIERYGVDRPDLRVPMEMVTVSDLVADIDFKVFAGPAKDPAGRVAALRVPGGNALSRKEIDGYTDFVGRYGAKGLAYIKCNDIAAGVDGLQSPIVKFFSEEAIKGVLERTGAEDGDLIFFGADKASVVNDAIGALRVKVGHDMKLIEGDWCPVWVVDFPMFEFDARENRWSAMHHPFTAPSVDAETLKSDPGAALSRAYDMVINGIEVGGGSIRIHSPEMQATVLELLGIDSEEAEGKFGFLLKALQYGAPPHGGIAFGLDRLIMMMAGADSIRDVMAFPKTQNASCLLTDAPGDVDERQLRELSLRRRLPAAES